MQFLENFERNVIHEKYPYLSTAAADMTTKQPLLFDQVKICLKLECDEAWRGVLKPSEV